jgi:hypothetical protein
MAAIVWGLIALVDYLISTFSKLSPNVIAAIVAAFATVTVSVLTIVIGKRLEALALITKEHREKKVPIYEEFIQFWFKHLFAKKSGEMPLSDEEIIHFLSDYTQRIMVWGSDEVIVAWVRFRYSSMNAAQSQTTTTVLEDYEKFILAIRKDLGHKNKGIQQGDILRLFVNDMNVGEATGT